MNKLLTKIGKILKDIFLTPDSIKHSSEKPHKVKKESPDPLPRFKIKEMFVDAKNGLNMRSTPEVPKERKENFICRLDHGQKLLVLNKQRDWFEIEYNDERGWVVCDGLVDESPIKNNNEEKISDVEDVLPEFKDRMPNLANNPNTIKIRKIIKDEFGGRVNGYDLQCTEYVHYRVYIKTDVFIDWPKDRPRHGGKWAEIFERRKKYNVSDKPIKWSAMSFANPKFNYPYGHIAFVEDVIDDGSIIISEANWPDKGIYRKKPLTKSQWQSKKYGAKFIEFV